MRQKEIQEIIKSLFETVESMFPELRSSYWNSRAWQSLKEEHLKPKRRANPPK